MVEVPRCCGKEMKVMMETLRFIETICQTCGDTIYLKKEQGLRPQLLDD